jgi:phage replication O-like protein O
VSEGASPQLEDGFTAFANELLEAMCKLRCPPSVMAALLAVARETYGWNEKVAPCPRARVAKHMGISERRARQAVDEAVAWGLLLKEGRKLGVQKDYTKWAKPEGRASGYRRPKWEGRASSKAEGRASASETLFPEEERKAGPPEKAEGRASQDVKDSKDNTSTSRTSASSDAGSQKQKKRRKETPEQLAIRETFEKLTGLDWPGGSPKGYSGLHKEVLRRGAALLLEWAASGHESTDPKDAKDLVGWYFVMAPENMRRAFNWQGKGDNSPPRPKGDGILQSIPGMPADPMTLRETDVDVVRAIAAHPAYDSQDFPVLAACLDGLTTQAVKAARRAHLEGSEWPAD